jgi:hypothetical protein
VHSVQIDHLGYTFAYDDVKPNISSPAAEVSGTVSTEGVRVLRIIVGGPNSENTQQVDSSNASEVSYGDHASSMAAQSSSTEDASEHDAGSSATASDQSDYADSSTLATRSPDAPATPTTSDQPFSETTVPEPVSLEPATTPVPSTLITIISTTTAYPGDSPMAYAPLGGVTAQHGNVVTVYETAIVTTVVTRKMTTTVLE